jgi:hypothetical protein
LGWGSCWSNGRIAAAAARATHRKSPSHSAPLHLRSPCTICTHRRRQGGLPWHSPPVVRLHLLIWLPVRYALSGDRLLVRDYPQLRLRPVPLTREEGRIPPSLPPRPHTCPSHTRFSTSTTPPLLRLPCLRPAASASCSSPPAPRPILAPPRMHHRYASPTGLKQLVHGSFMTKAAWKIITSAGRQVLVTRCHLPSRALMPSRPLALCAGPHIPACPLGAGSS